MQGLRGPGGRSQSGARTWHVSLGIAPCWHSTPPALHPHGPQQALSDVRAGAAQARAVLASPMRWWGHPRGLQAGFGGGQSGHSAASAGRGNEGWLLGVQHLRRRRGAAMARGAHPSCSAQPWSKQGLAHASRGSVGLAWLWRQLLGDLLFRVGGASSRRSSSRPASGGGIPGGACAAGGPAPVGIAGAKSSVAGSLGD